MPIGGLVEQYSADTWRCSRRCSPSLRGHHNDLNDFNLPLGARLTVLP